MHFVSYFQLGSAAFLLFQHPIVGMLVTLPFIWFAGEDPIIFLPGVLGAASTYATLRSLKERVWPGIMPSVFILCAPMFVMEVPRISPENTSVIPWVAYAFIVLLTQPFIFNAEMLYRHTMYTVVTVALCTTIFQEDLKMQLNTMVVHTLFLVVISYFADSTKLKNKKKE